MPEEDWWVEVSCFMMGNHADVKEKLRRWQYERERGYCTAPVHPERWDTGHSSVVGLKQEEGHPWLLAECQEKG